MRKKFLGVASGIFALAAMGAPPALANHVDNVHITADCNGFTVFASGVNYYPDPAITYSLSVNAPSGPTVGGTFSVSTDQNFTGSVTKDWSNFGVVLSGQTCLAGSATLTTNGGSNVENTVTIDPLPCFTCANTCVGTIGDFVWRDTDCDGIQDFGEGGLNGVTVRLKDAKGNTLQTTVTNTNNLMNGYYQFRNVCQGTYFVEVDTSTLPPGATPAPCTTGSSAGNDSNCSPASVGLTGGNSSDQTIDFGYCAPSVGKTFTIGPSSMEGHLTIMPGDWISGGFSFKFKNGSHPATSFTVSSTASVAVTCPKGGGSGGTIIVDLGTKTYSIPAGNTDWLPTGDANSVLSWMGAAQAPNLCNGYPMDNARGAVYTATVSQNPPSGSLVDFRFKYRDPNAKGKGNVNCLDTTDPRRAKADVCGASWSQTVLDP